MRILLLLLVLGLLFGWWWLRRRPAATTRPTASPQRRLDQNAVATPSEYHAVSIKTGPYACDAARKLEGRRILAAEAPRLPVPGCDRETCECRFQHYADRRTGRDRRSPFGSGGLVPGTGNFDAERRQADGRRSDD